MDCALGSGLQISVKCFTGDAGHSAGPGVAQALQRLPGEQLARVNEKNIDAAPVVQGRCRRER